MPKKIDLTNKRFEKWQVIREATLEEKQNRPGAYWLCKCDCGTEKIVNGQLLRNGQSTSCGCGASEKISKANKNKAEDLTGQIFGRLTVLERDFDAEEAHPKRGSTYWKCKCQCGNIISTTKLNLKNGVTKSCGCLQKEIASKNMYKLSFGNYIDLTNQRFGKLVVLKKVEGLSGSNSTLWLCQCDCGNQKIIESRNLRSGFTQSCGCLKQSHGELLIEQLLAQNHILFQKEYLIKIKNKNLRFDFAIFNNEKLQYLIEFDGKQHFEPIDFFGGEEYFKKIQENDNLKNQWCKDNNIPLIRISYKDYDKITIKDLLWNNGNNQ